MGKTKKPIDPAFENAVKNTLGRQSPYDIARAHHLPTNAIARALADVDPQLARAIEIAKALGFELRYEWQRGSDTELRTRTLAMELAKQLQCTGMSPKFEELTKDRMIWAFAMSVAEAYEDCLRWLGPDETGDPDRVFEQQLKGIEHMRKVANPEAKAGEAQKDVTISHLAARLAELQVKVMRPELAEPSKSGLREEALALAFADYMLQLGPTKTADPEKTYNVIRRALERQKAIGAKRGE